MPIEQVLTEGLRLLSADQHIVFTQYNKAILPADKFVFWVKTATTKSAFGSLHFATELAHEPESNNANSNIVFTTKDKLWDLQTEDPTSIWIGDYDGFQFVAASQGMFYEQANLWHYQGQSISAEFQTQLLTDISQVGTIPVIPNCTALMIQAIDSFSPATLKAYPAFMSPLNHATPFVTIMVNKSEPMAGSFRATDGVMWQPYKDDVELICYAMRGFNHHDLKDWILDKAVTEYDYGVMTIPKVSFINEPSKELQTQSQKIKIEFTVSYYQNNAINTARQLILNALITVLPNPK